MLWYRYEHAARGKLSAPSVPDEFVASITDQFDPTRTGASYIEQITSEPFRHVSAICRRMPRGSSRDILDDGKLCQHHAERFAKRVSEDFRVEAILQT
jgi:hypothetical protein